MNLAGRSIGNAFPTRDKDRIAVDRRYKVQLAKNSYEVASAMRLRHQVFKVELGGQSDRSGGSNLEFDAYDFKSRHLIVTSTKTGELVGTYRLNTIETAGNSLGFYSSNEFFIGNLPSDILQNGVEIGRACVAKEHRNTKVLFLLWKGLMDYLVKSNKRYFFGCCSIITQDEGIGALAYRQLAQSGQLHDQYRVTPRRNAVSHNAVSSCTSVKLPSLFNMYLRIGAKVCGPPMIDSDFGTIDFFVLFDVTKMNEKYRGMFVI